MTIDVESLVPEVDENEAPTDLPEPEVTTDAPADKPAQARDESGKFAAKEPKEEKPKEEAKAPEAPKPEPKTIPLAAHLEERKALKAQLDAMQKELETLKNPPKPPAPTPDYANDPKAYVDHRVQSALEKLEGTSKQVEEVKQTAQLSAQQAEELRFSQTLQAAEAAFVREKPDYYEALAHVRSVRANQLRLFAPGISDQEIAQQIGREEMGLAMQLARANQNPIATVYQLAEAYGYQRKQAEQPPALPFVPKQNQLPPDQTLGSGASSGDDGDAASNDPFADAFSEMFGRKKAS